MFTKEVIKYILIQILCFKIYMHLSCVAEEINDVTCVSSHICSPKKEEELLNDITPNIQWTTTPSCWYSC